MITESPIQSQLEQYLNEIQTDFNIDADGSVPPGEEVKKHERRMGQIAVDWDVHWDEVVDGLIASYATIPSLCWICKKSLAACYTRCLCCVKTVTSNSIHGMCSTEYNFYFKIIN